MAKRASKKTSLRPGTLLKSGMAVIDARGRVRALPKDPGAQERVLAGIRRVVKLQELEAARAKRPDVPTEVQRHVLLGLLRKMGFKHREKRGGTSTFVSSEHGTITVPMGSSGTAIRIRANRRLRQVVEAYLESGGKL